MINLALLFTLALAPAEPFEIVTVFEQAGQANYHIPNLVVANDGTVLAFCEERWGSAGDDVSECHIVLRRSVDHGRTWLAPQTLRRQDGAKWHMGSACVDRTTGTIFLMCGGGWLKSDDHGATWVDWKPAIERREGVPGAGTHGSAPGITLQHGPHAGRLLWPARAVDKTDGYDDRSIPDRQAKCFTTALYSDDHGATLKQANVFLPGTGEAALVERLDGSIYLNARAYFGDGKRRTAISRDGGATFTEEGLAPTIREVNQGCSAGLVRYPPEQADGRDLILFSNPDRVDSRRTHGILRASPDGGETWPHALELGGDDDWFDYSSLAVAHDGTILCLAKSTATGRGAPGFSGACSMVLFRVPLGAVVDEKG